MLLAPSLQACRAKWSLQFLRRGLTSPQLCWASSLTSRKRDAIYLPVGGNGQIKLNISSPTTVASGNNILLHLPPGPFPNLESLRPEPLDLAQLEACFARSTIIAINYRLGPRLGSEDHRFPTPIHDVFTAWDYVIDPNSDHNNLLGAEGVAYLKPRVCLHGAHIGGALALTLALTNSEHIHALALEEPLVDWVILDEFVEAVTEAATSTAQSSKRSKSALQSTEFLQARAEAAKALIKLRTNLFRTPSGYFDMFASPTLFLRAPGRDTPLTRTAAPEEKNEDAYIAFEGEEIRYGDDEDEVGWVEYEERDAFGPYDDDYHALSGQRVVIELDDSSPDGLGVVSGTEPTSATSGGISDQTLTDLSQWTPRSGISKSREPSRRRKVLRRWPPNMQSGEIMLPSVQIYLQEPDLDQRFDAGAPHFAFVSHAQGVELRDLLRRACFWGREKSIAEETVNMTVSGAGSDDGRPSLRSQQVLQWLHTKIEED